MIPIAHQKWICPKCKGKDRTQYVEEPNLRKCWRCGEILNQDGVFIQTEEVGRLI